MSIIVAVPLQYATIKVHVDKGRHWSVVEHVLLHAICKQPRSARQLAKAGDLPLRLVIEALINLMRAGWADLRSEGDHMVFAATAGGMANVELDKLPPVTRPLARVTKFAIEQVTGSVLRWREISFAPQKSPRMDYANVVKLPTNSRLPPHNQTEIVAALLEDDERFRGADVGSARPGVGYALVTVSGQKFEGLPRNSQRELVDRIRAAAKTAVGDKTSVEVAKQADAAPADLFRMSERSISFSASDLIVGGAAHLAARDDLIAKAKSLLVIQSTFFSKSAIDALLPNLFAAARERGVRIHLFHGKNDKLGSNNPTVAALTYLQERIREEGLGTLIQAHAFSTRSHAKIIIADDGGEGFVGLIGSCNWLSTSFNLFEASFRVSDAGVISDFANALSQMAFEATGHDGGIGFDLAGLSLHLRQTASVKGRGTARVVLGPEHGHMLDIARDHAVSRILIGSHRLGASAETLSLIPTRAAIRAKKVVATAYYSEVDGDENASASKTVADGDVTMVELADMHAKFLVWDDDNLLLTSHNLLSADPLSPWSEIGLHLTAPGIGQRFAQYIEEFHHL